MRTPKDWKHAIPIGVAKWFRENCVKRIDYGWRMTSEDSSEDWIIAFSEYGNASIKLPTSLYPELEFRPGPGGLLRLRASSNVARDLDEITEWQMRNSVDIETYQKLKQKFKGTAFE